MQWSLSAERTRQNDHAQLVRAGVSLATDPAFKDDGVKGTKMSNTVSEAPRNLAAQFATESTDRLNARRNMRVGLWAGAKLGLPEERRAVYALEVMLSGMIDFGHDDVIDKIMHDFNKHEIPMTRGQILAQLSKEHYCVMTLSHLNESRRPAAPFIAAHALTALRRTETTLPTGKPSVIKAHPPLAQ
jgi:hypothetical protein